MKVRIAGANGIAVVRTGILVCLFPMFAVVRIGIADILWEEQRRERKGRRVLTKLFL